MPDEKYSEKLTELYKSLSQRLYAAAYALLQNAADAEDAVSEVFLWLCENREKFEPVPEEKKPAYIKTALKNICFDALRKRKKRPNDELSEEIPDLRLSVEEKALGKARREELEKFIESLSDAQKQALYLRIHYDFTTRNIAKILNISETAARKRLSDAGKQIKNFLEESNYV